MALLVKWVLMGIFEKFPLIATEKMMTSSKK